MLSFHLLQIDLKEKLFSYKNWEKICFKTQNYCFSSRHLFSSCFYCCCWWGSFVSHGFFLSQVLESIKRASRKFLILILTFFITKLTTDSPRSFFRLFVDFFCWLISMDSWTNEMKMKFKRLSQVFVDISFARCA